MTHHSTWPFIAAGTLVVALVVAQFALPGVVKHYVNRKLAAHPTYPGHVEDVDLAPLRGAYRLEGVTFEKRGGTAPVPFMEVDAIDLSVQWKALLQGAFVAEVVVTHPRINFVTGPTEADKQAGTEADWRKQIRELAPLRINRVAVNDGEVHYSDFSTAPPVDVVMKDLQVEVFNLTNSEDLSGTLVATVTATGLLQDYGEFRVDGSVDPYADAPTFDMDATLTGVPLTSLNDLFGAYGKFDVESGTMDVYTEVAASDGRFLGYVKPLFTDVRIAEVKEDVREDRDNPLRLAWESLVGTGTRVLVNPKTKLAAAKIPVGGTFTEPAVDVWSGAASTVSNAFIEAIRRGLDHEIERPPTRRRLKRIGRVEGPE